jgi:hypothetical protein
MGFKTNQELQSVAIIKLKNTVPVCYITSALSDLPVSAVGLTEVHRMKLIYPVYLYMIYFLAPFLYSKSMHSTELTIRLFNRSAHWSVQQKRSTTKGLQ